jgi:hypothetical protein
MYTKHVRDRCRRTCDISRISTAITRTFNYYTTVEVLVTGRQDLQDKPPVIPIPLLCLPTACRRNTALGCPRLVDLTCLVWPTLPQVFSPPSMLVYYFFWPLFLRFAHATCFPYAFRPLQEYTIRLRVAKPDEPFGPCAR